VDAPQVAEIWVNTPRFGQGSQVLYICQFKVCSEVEYFGQHSILCFSGQRKQLHSVLLEYVKIGSGIGSLETLLHQICYFSSEFGRVMILRRAKFVLEENEFSG